MASKKKSKALLRKDNSTGYHGVTKDGNGNFIAQIYHNGKTKRLYSGKSAEKAAQAYDKAAAELKGDRAKLNFPSKPAK